MLSWVMVTFPERFACSIMYIRNPLDVEATAMIKLPIKPTSAITAPIADDLAGNVFVAR